MSKTILVFFSLLFIFSCTRKEQEIHSAKGTGLYGLAEPAPPRVTPLASLPDSLQPKTISLSVTPKPFTVTVPARKGSSYTDHLGNKINLEPPVKTLLPVLLDEKGEPVKDDNGNSFLMGTGGIANFTNFTTDNGLALDAVSCSITDKKGNLWFGTYGGGVSRYDGRSFTNYTTAQGLANNTVWSIAEDKAGNLWFGTDGGGVSRYDGNAFSTFTTVAGLANNVVYSIAEDRSGKLWFGTNGGGISRYDPSPSVVGSKSFTTFTTAQGLAGNTVHSIFRDRSGNVWFGTGEGGVSRYDGSTFTTFSITQGLANNAVFSIAEDRSGKLWFGTNGGGVSRYAPSAPPGSPGSFTSFTTAQGLANNVVKSIIEDKAGNIWFGTNGGGISRYDASASPGASPAKNSGAKLITTFTTAQGLANNTVFSIVEDRAGNIWFGTDGGGLSRYDGRAFSTFSTTQGLANNIVFSIAESKTGNLWFGTYGGGVSCYDGKSFTNFTTAQGLAHNVVYGIAEDHAGNIWFGTNGGGVTEYDGKAFTTFTTAQGVANNAVYSIAEDKAGCLWFGTGGGGVSRYNGNSFTTFTMAQGLANNTVLSITVDKTGNIWFGTQGGGVSLYNGRSFTTLTATQGLANNTVFRIAEDKAGNLWFGTQEGLSVMSNDIAVKLSAGTKAITGDGQIFHTFNTADGLPDNLVTQVFQMPDGRMAAGTNLGIAIFKPTADLTTLSDMEIYNSVTGYPVKDINGGQNCMLPDSKGIIWAGTGSEKTALVRFDPSALNMNNEPPTLVIKSIKVNEEQVCWHDIERAVSGERRAVDAKTDSNVIPAYITEEITTTGRRLSVKERDGVKKRYKHIRFDSISRFYPIPANLVLPYDKNHITIDFNAIETGKPSHVQYQYMLEGYDNDWSPAQRKTSATFGNIHEGTYTFKVKAQGPNGVWCEPVLYSFSVLPPWYRTWWAYLAELLIFLLALRTFTKYRERRLRREKETLEHKVEERTAVIEQQKEELVHKNMVVEEQKTEVEKQKRRSDELLFNILPKEVAEELKDTGTSQAKHFDNVTVLFTDFISFTSTSERMSPQGLIDELHTCFQAFDEITSKHNIEKIKTIGDAYLAVAGLPIPDPKHAENAVLAAIEISNFMRDRVARLGKDTFHIRIGIHSGSVIAGIVGVKKFAYDIWGDTVNTAARMEQSCESGKINISQTTYELIKNVIPCTYRGEIHAKGKGNLKMYYIAG